MGRKEEDQDILGGILGGLLGGGGGGLEKPVGGSTGYIEER